jgi:Cu/Ag efflux protein CusF
MKKHQTILSAAFLLGALGPAVAAQPAAAESQMMVASAPGKAMLAQTHKVVATVEAIDVAKRQVTLKGPKGKVKTMEVGPDVRNLEQVKVGDRVVVAYLEALSLSLMKDGKELPSSSATTDGARAAAGERPGGIVGEQVKVTANVVGVNAKTHMVTLRGPNQTVDLHVADPQQLKLIKVGDQVEALYTQALAVSVEPAAPKK